MMQIKKSDTLNPKRLLQPLRISALALFGLAFISCVSVNIGPRKAEKSQGVSVRPPPSPFQKLEASGADEAWQNKSSGNTISYYSTCNDPADPPLESIQGELLSGLDNLEILRSGTTTFNSREALATEAEGLMDGIKTHIETMIFKKNNCIYTISYVGVAKTFALDQAKFHDFLKTFEAP